ncbi:hypothetical protein BKA70DRAFT_1054259, partial [Coprinopsis sp. MPI-PUGE-AT-0042]
VIYHEAPEGKTWKDAVGLPKKEITMVSEHSFHNRYAFALTDGTTHFRREDRGKTWQ